MTNKQCVENTNQLFDAKHYNPIGSHTEAIHFSKDDTADWMPNRKTFNNYF